MGFDSKLLRFTLTQFKKIEFMKLNLRTELTFDLKKISKWLETLETVSSEENELGIRQPVIILSDLLKMQF